MPKTRIPPSQTTYTSNELLQRLPPFPPHQYYQGLYYQPKNASHKDPLSPQTAPAKNIQTLELLIVDLWSDKGSLGSPGTMPEEGTYRWIQSPAVQGVGGHLPGYANPPETSGTTIKGYSCTCHPLSVEEDNVAHFPSTNFRDGGSLCILASGSRY